MIFWKSYIAEWQLQPHLLRGQAYDGAGAIAGKPRELLLGPGKISQSLVHTPCSTQVKPVCNEMLQYSGG